jgi:CheY-like chemotaxis protein
MKRILFIEDDEPKLVQVLEFLEELSCHFSVTVAKSLSSACKEIDGGTFDVVLLDMSLPTFDGGKTANASGRQRTYGGKDILMYLWETETEVKVYVITQFKDFPGEKGAIDLPELHAQLGRDFPTLYCDHVYFEHNSDSWKEKLSRLLLD